MPGVAEGTEIPGSSGMTYRPLLELGEGGMARIVLALAAGPGGFNKLVVLKVIRSAQDSTEIRRLLLAEARLSARLNHPNVVQVQEVVHTEEGPYLVMEYLDGRPLSAVRDCAAITPNIVMTAISEALSGLHHAHELTDFDGTPLHIVHRDVSPHNIFLTFDGVAKVLDFGIAKMRNETTSTETGSVKGKIAYMPPEQLLGEGVDRRADIFAAGSMLWEAATSARMWANASQQPPRACCRPHALGGCHERSHVGERFACKLDASSRHGGHSQTEQRRQSRSGAGAHHRASDGSRSCGSIPNCARDAARFGRFPQRTRDACVVARDWRSALGRFQGR